MFTPNCKFNTEKSTQFNFFIKLITCLTLSILIALSANAAKGGNPGKPGGGGDSGDEEVTYYSEASHPSAFGQKQYEFYCNSPNYDENCMGSFDVLPAPENNPFLYTPIARTRDEVSFYNEADWFPNGENLLIQVDIAQQGYSSDLNSYNFAIVESPSFVGEEDTESGLYHLVLPDIDKQFRLLLHPNDGPNNFKYIGYLNRFKVRSIGGQIYIVALIEDRSAYTEEDRFGNIITVNEVYVGFWKINTDANNGGCTEDDITYGCIGWSISERDESLPLGSLDLPDDEFEIDQIRFPNAVFQLKDNKFSTLDFDVVTYTQIAGEVDIEHSYLVYKIYDHDLYLEGKNGRQLIAQQISFGEGEELTLSDNQEIWARSWETKHSTTLNVPQLFNEGLIFNTQGKEKGYYYCAINDEIGRPDCGCDSETLAPCSKLTKILDYDSLDRNCRPDLWFNITPDGNYILALARGNKDTSCNGMFALDIDVTSPTATELKFQKISDYEIHPKLIKFKPLQ